MERNTVSALFRFLMLCSTAYASKFICVVINGSATYQASRRTRSVPIINPTENKETSMETNYVTYCKQLRPMSAKLDYYKGHMTVIYGGDIANYVAKQMSKVIEILYDLNTVIATFSDDQEARDFYVDHRSDMIDNNEHLIVISDEMNVGPGTFSIILMADNVLTVEGTPKRFTVRVVKNRATGQTLVYTEELKCPIR